MNDDDFAKYLYYEKKLNPFEIAIKSIDELKKLKLEWQKEKGIEVEDIVFSKLSLIDKKITNDHLVSVIKKMTSTDLDQTNKVGSWIFYCLQNNKEKADNAKSKVSDKYINILTKYLDSFVNQLIHE